MLINDNSRGKKIISYIKQRQGIDNINNMKPFRSERKVIEVIFDYTREGIYEMGVCET